MFGFLKRKIKKEEKASSINLKEFAEIRKNKKTVYSDEDVMNYCLELFKNNFLRYEEITAKDLKKYYVNSSKYYDYMIWIELENVYKKFVGLTLTDILNIINNEYFNDILEDLMKDWIKRDVLEEITYKTEFEFSDVQGILEERKRIVILGRSVKSLNATLRLYFKFD